MAHLSAECAFCDGGAPPNGHQGRLGATDLSAAGLQRVLLVGQQVVVHGVHKQAVTLRVHHQPGHRLHLAHQLAGGDRLETHVGNDLSGVQLALRVKVQPLHGQLWQEFKGKAAIVRWAKITSGVIYKYLSSSSLTSYVSLNLCIYSCVILYSRMGGSLQI